MSRNNVRQATGRKPRYSKSTRVIFPTLCLLFAFSVSHSSSAQTGPDLEKKLNDSQICTPLKFDIKKVAEFLGYKIPPVIPGDTTVGWDKNAHKVRNFSFDANRRLTADIEIGCQPSSEGALLKVFGKKAGDFRITDSVDCSGAVNPDGSVPNLSCKVSGEGAKFLGAISDLTGQLKSIFKVVMTRK